LENLWTIDPEHSSQTRFALGCLSGLSSLPRQVHLHSNELRDALQLRLSGKFKRFADEQLRARLTLLASPGVVWELAFGSWALLQPERIAAYAQTVIRTLQEG
jgi:hypothetical protein